MSFFDILIGLCYLGLAVAHLVRAVLDLQA